MDKQLITIYCDEPSHTPDPVGPFVHRAPDALRSGQVQIELSRREGVEIVATMQRYNNTRLWMPLMKTVRGLSKRGGGLQKVPEGASFRSRYRPKCQQCGLALGRGRREPWLSDRLTALADAGIAAVSLRAVQE